MFNNDSAELDIKCKICEIVDDDFKFTNKHKKTTEDEYDSQFKDYRDINQDEKAKYVTDKLSKLTIHEKLQNVILKKLRMDFVCTGLYPSEMWDANSVNPKKESGCASKPHMNDVYVVAFKNQSFNQDGNDSAILKNIYYNSLDLKFQHLPVKEKIKNIQIKR